MRNGQNEEIYKQNWANFEVLRQLEFKPLFSRSKQEISPPAYRTYLLKDD